MKFQGCQLAKEYDPAKAGFPLLAEPKLDGYRLMACIDERGGVMFHCRDEKPVAWNLNHIALALVRAGFRDCIVDGEVMAEDWGKTAIVKRKTLSAEDRKYLRTKVKFYMFDLLFEGPDPGQRRRKYRFVDYTEQPELVYVEDRLVHSHSEVLLYQQDALAAGYEGCVLKEPDAPYAYRRSSNWLKVKPLKTIEAEVVGLVAGKGKHAGRLGALECRDAQGRTFNVGTGFSDEQRKQIWDTIYQGKDVVGVLNSIVEVSVQDCDVGVVRHPTFVRFRPDRASL